MYEWLSKVLVYFVAIENHLERKDLKKMKHTSKSKLLGIVTLEDFCKLDNGRRREISEESLFLTEMHSSFWLNGQLRNAIGHYKIDYDPRVQVIKYCPYKEPKKQDRYKKISLIKFAHLNYLSIQSVHQALHLLFNLDLEARRTQI